jgi:hypothetical protein
MENKESNEIFIIDEELIEIFFNPAREYVAELFFNYLSSWCVYPKAYMIPSLHKKIIDWIKINSMPADNKLIQTKVIADFKNWVEEADLLGEDDGNYQHDTELLINILKLIYPDKKIVMVSSKYKANPIKSIDCEELFSYIGSKKEFMDFFERKYNIGNWDSSY